MKYDEYLKCAKKHLIGCESIFGSYSSGKTSDLQVWLELYYLSGYILEGVVVYSAYKINGWNRDDDIQGHYNRLFTEYTNLDYWVCRKHKSTGAPVFKNRSSEALNVEKHAFQHIVKQLLKKDPSFKDVPYIGDGEIDDDVRKLIEDWKPGIRYNYDAKKMPSLNRDIIGRLINTCKIIFSNHK